MGVVGLISIQRLTGDNKMKVLAVLLLCGLSAAWKDPAQSQHEMYQSWVGMKAMESCWGEENIKTQTINLKLAVAQCSQQDAPELSLPPFRSPYKFINTLLTSADEKEQQQIVFIHKMLQEMNGNSHGQYNNNNDYNGFSNSNSNNVFKKMMMMKLMNKYMSNNHHDSVNYGNMFMDVDQFNYDFMDHEDYSNYNVDKIMDKLFEDKMKENMMKYKMQQMHGSDVDKWLSYINPSAKNSYREKMTSLIQRHKRQAKPAGGASVTLPQSLDLGDKLADKLKQEQELIKSSVGNMTCVMKKMGVINDQNELDINTQKRSLKKLNFDSKWLHDRIEDDMEMCVNMANALPNEVQHRFHYPGMVNLSKLKAYKKCCLETRLRTCAFYDVKKTLESNYGSMDSILEQTKMTEDQLLPLMLNLLYGDELPYRSFQVSRILNLLNLNCHTN